MTQQISELEAGRELDHVVADIVGWEQLSPVHEPPEFSVSHEAAARVKQFLRDHGIEFAIGYKGDTVTVLPTQGDYQIARAESEPLALCRFLARLDSEGVLDHDCDCEGCVSPCGRAQ